MAHREQRRERPQPPSGPTLQAPRAALPRPYPLTSTPSGPLLPRAPRTGEASGLPLGVLGGRDREDDVSAGDREEGVALRGPTVERLQGDVGKREEVALEALSTSETRERKPSRASVTSPSMRWRGVSRRTRS